MKSGSIPLIGAHMSVAGGFDKAVAAGVQIGCACVQFFTHSNRQWTMQPLTPDVITDFKEALRISPLICVVHASYLINTASPTEEVRKKSTTTLTKELINCEQLGIPYLIMHPGSRLTASSETGISNIAASLNEVLEAVPGQTMILLELMAGSGGAVGSSFEELAEIRARVKHKKRIGFCFDTCHAFAAGYNFSTQKAYDAMWQDFDRIIGLEHLKAFHLNDSLKGLGSHVDRHAAIGEGQLGLEPFRLILNDTRFKNIPKILETPHKTIEDDARNLATLRKLLDI